MSTVTQDEPHTSLGSRLNWLRAGVLGANDGIVSVAGIVVGVAGATIDRATILTAGVAGLAAGAMSMAVGEYVSVSTQRDTEAAMIELEQRELHEEPEQELDELTGLYAAKGLPPDLARQVALALTEHDALAAHLDAELRIDPTALTNPWHAAFASFVAFTVGALLPLVAIALPGPSWRVPVTVVAVVLALALSGLLAGRLGSAPLLRPVRRNVAGGLLAMAITYGIGTLVGVAV
ncbi:MAG TPA: VIT family protein [Dermatophilaceae bacterium]|nr:VIT family protein [Dermatophilaceae bacterium]